MALPPPPLYPSTSLSLHTSLPSLIHAYPTHPPTPPFFNHSSPPIHPSFSLSTPPSFLYPTLHPSLHPFSSLSQHLSLSIPVSFLLSIHPSTSLRPSFFPHSIHPSTHLTFSSFSLHPSISYSSIYPTHLPPTPIPSLTAHTYIYTPIPPSRHLSYPSPAHPPPTPPSMPPSIPPRAFLSPSLYPFFPSSTIPFSTCLSQGLWTKPHEPLFLCRKTERRLSEKVTCQLRP